MERGKQRTKAEFDILGRIKIERDKRGWSDYELAENAGFTSATIATWNNKKIEPGVASIEKICAGLGISLSQFFQEGESGLTADQQEIFELWAKLSPEQRNAVKELIQSFLCNHNHQ